MAWPDATWARRPLIVGPNFITGKAWQDERAALGAGILVGQCRAVSVASGIAGGSIPEGAYDEGRFMVHHCDLWGVRRAERLLGW
jgi:hypothetical protein